MALVTLALQAKAGPFSYRLTTDGHEFICRGCGEGARGRSFEAVARWRDEHVCGEQRR